MKQLQGQRVAINDATRWLKMPHLKTQQKVAPLRETKNMRCLRGWDSFPYLSRVCCLATLESVRGWEIVRFSPSEWAARVPPLTRPTLSKDK